MVETRASRWGASKDTGTRASSPRTPLPAPCVPQNQDAQPAQNSQSEGDVISRLIPFLITLQETQRQIFQLIIDQENHVPLPSSDDCPAQRVTLVNSKDLVTMKHSLGIQESLFSWSVRKLKPLSGKRQALPCPFLPSSCLYTPKKWADGVSPRGQTPKLQKFDRQKGHAKEHVRRFLALMGTFSYVNALCPEIILQILDRQSLHLVCQPKGRDLYVTLSTSCLCLMQSSSTLRSTSL